MKKLTDEELSRVLSQQAVGKLDHAIFYSRGDECGCIAGAVLALGGHPTDVGADFCEVGRAFDISDAVCPAFGWDYPDTPDALLAYLAERGLA